MTTWAIVENAGYERERIVRKGLRHYTVASDEMHRMYDDDEIETLHVDVAREEADGLSYDY